jgi:hypothetical protein
VGRRERRRRDLDAVRSPGQRWRIVAARCRDPLPAQLRRDLTADYLATASRKLDVADRFAGDMVGMLGRQAYEEMQAERRLAISAIEAGLLRRALFVACRPRANSRTLLNS